LPATLVTAPMPDDAPVIHTTLSRNRIAASLLLI